MDFETNSKERFNISFNNIRNIEKDAKNERKVKIIQDTVFNREFVCLVDNRKRFLDDIKKFWNLNNEIQEMNQALLKGSTTTKTA